MLEDYAMKHGFTNLVHFTDDGWSGATFDRPSWNRLVEGVKNGEITACICKDMSRIGRDHLQVGFFTDILFREKEVRFIAINNGIDSDRQETSEFAPFLNIMNEWFVRDTSKKIKAVLKSRGSSGNAHTSNIPPYGYLKDPENPDHWIIDEEAAEVVRRIYRMTIEGKGPYQIARELSEEKIERPSYYLGKKGLGNHASNYDKENPYMWRGNQVTTLIARPEYIGKTVNFRTFKNSYKDKKTKRADKEDWVVFDDTQEPIVDEETWLLAQKLRQNVRKADPMGEPNVLTGKIYCADCGAPMYNHRQRKGRERIYYMTVNDPILDLQILRSQSVKQHLPSKNLSLIFKHKPKKRKFFAGQNNLVPALIYMKSINIYTQLFISKQGWILIFRSPTAKNSRNLAQQDFRRKGLWNVIVNLLFKTPQLVFFIRKRSKHNNRDL